eukprot:1162101-Pelagomonas_calceolata.AAC.8
MGKLLEIAHIYLVRAVHYMKEPLQTLATSPAKQGLRHKRFKIAGIVAAHRFLAPCCLASPAFL